MDYSLGEISEKYNLMGPIGKGGFGVVLKGYDYENERLVALKLLSPEFVKGGNSSAIDEIYHEARCLSRLDHPNIIKCYGVIQTCLKGNGWESKTFGLVLEYFEGRDLETAIDGGESKQLDLAEKTRIVLETARTLSYAHGQRIIHGDVKPGNVLYDGQTIKLIDWAFARDLDGDNPSVGWGIVSGTPAFIAPEYVAGEDGKTFGMDIFSLGMFFYCLSLDKSSPFPGLSNDKLVDRIMRNVLSDLDFSQFPSEVADLIKGMLQRNLGDRSTGEEVISGLEKMLS